MCAWSYDTEWREFPEKQLGDMLKESGAPNETVLAKHLKYHFLLS